MVQGVSDRYLYFESQNFFRLSLSVPFKISLQARIGAIAFSSFALAHTFYVKSERSRVPSGRLLHFSPGSQDEIISNSLKTGDLLLFQRDATLYFLPGALICALRFYRSESLFDQAGVIVMIKGEPCVLERSLSGRVQCRPYDARIKCSRSATILVRPTSLLLSPPEGKTAIEYSRTMTASPAPLEPLFLLKELVSLLFINKDHNSSIDLVNDFYSMILQGRSGYESSKTSQQGITMRDLSAPNTPRHADFSTTTTESKNINSSSVCNKRIRSRDVYVRDKLL